MTQDTDLLLSQIIDILNDFTPDNTPVTKTHHLMNDLELDSVKVMELMMILEDHFDLSIPLNILPNVNTVADLAGEIAHLKQQANQ